MKFFFLFCCSQSPEESVGSLGVGPELQTDVHVGAGNRLSKLSLLSTPECSSAVLGRFKETFTYLYFPFVIMTFSFYVFLTRIFLTIHSLSLF